MSARRPLALLSFPWDGSSSYARGAALAPPIIRALMASDISTDYSLSGVRVSEAIAREVEPALSEDAAETRAEITKAVAAALAEGLKPLSLGGDHSVTFPILRAMKAKHGALNVLHIDAHPDLYDELNGDRYSHACPFARSLEEGLIANLVQVGLRSVTPAQRALGKKHNVTMRGAEAWEDIPYERLTAPLYVTIDLDGLDPAFAPGVSHPEPGGLSTREVLAILGKLRTAPVGADITELNPAKDVNLLTAHVAVRLVKELAALMAGSNE